MNRWMVAILGVFLIVNGIYLAFVIPQGLLLFGIAYPFLGIMLIVAAVKK